MTHSDNFNSDKVIRPSEVGTRQNEQVKTSSQEDEGSHSLLTVGHRDPCNPPPPSFYVYMGSSFPTPYTLLFLSRFSHIN
jgi:hypothetical protein